MQVSNEDKKLLESNLSSHISWEWKEIIIKASKQLQDIDFDLNTDNLLSAME